MKPDITIARTLHAIVKGRYPSRIRGTAYDIADKAGVPVANLYPALRAMELNGDLIRTKKGTPRHPQMEIRLLRRPLRSYDPPLTPRTWEVYELMKQKGILNDDKWQQHYSLHDVAKAINVPYSTVCFAVRMLKEAGLCK